MEGVPVNFRRVSARALEGRLENPRLALSVDWWVQASRQPRAFVEVTQTVDGFFTDVLIYFPTAEEAEKFDEKMATIGITTNQTEGHPF